MNPFFVMPGSALLGLREELELLAGDYAGETLERMGYRAGLGLVKSLEVGATDLQSFADIFTQLWSESGLSRAFVKKTTKEEIVVTFDESIEAAHGRRCDFTRGYLSGIASALLGSRYDAHEVVCMSQGSEKCVHHLIPSNGNCAPMNGEVAQSPIVHVLESGCSYLIESEDPSDAYNIFQEYVAHGHPGMCIVREYPERLKKRFGLDRACILWLSFERELSYAREPTNIPLIYSEIKSFLDSQEEGIVLLSGLEYLVSQNTFIRILKFIQLLNECAAVTDSIILMPVSPAALNAKEVKQLERELRVLNTTNGQAEHLEMMKQEDCGASRTGSP
jgi:predicted hydrocarbon binding protein